jgi:exodeoxyribonuclease VII small subunit
MARGKKKTGFEEQLKELEAIVSRLEGGDLSLEESLDLFERGIRMSRELQSSLQAANLRVTRLLEGEGTGEIPFEGGAIPQEGQDGSGDEA